MSEQQKPQQQPKKEVKHHDAFRVWYATRGRMRKRTGLALKRSELKHVALFAGLMIFLAIFMGVFSGLALEHYVIDPPIHYTGICSAPAQVTNGGCYIVNCSVNTNNQRTCTYTPSGRVLFPNATATTTQGK